MAWLCWGAMLLISTVLADLFHRAQRGRSVYVAASAALLAMGVLAFAVMSLIAWRLDRAGAHVKL